MRSKIAASLFICAFLAVYAHTGIKHRELYPFSTFSMYSGVRAKTPYIFSRYEIDGVLPGGDRVEHLKAPLGPSILLKWRKLAKRRNDDALLEAVGEALYDFNDRVRAHHGEAESFEKIIVYRVRYKAHWPHPETVSRIGRKGLLEVLPPDGRGDP